jgi:ABC-type spermidine/putrescine transport system permease subunit II
MQKIVAMFRKVTSPRARQSVRSGDMLAAFANYQVLATKYLLSLFYRNPQRLHLPIQMAALQPQDLGGPRHVAVVFVQLLQNVVALVSGAGLVQRGKARRGRSSAFTMDQRRQVLALNLVRRWVHDDQPLNYVAQLADISWP